MSIVPRFFFTLFKGGLRPIWERVSALYLNFLDDNYIVSGTPSTFDSYVTHSRNGNATMTDSDGLIKWAPHNLVKYSEQFDNAAWVNGTATANTDIAPDGTLTADTLSLASGVGRVQDGALSISAGNKVTFGVWIKAGTATTCRIGIARSGAGTYEQAYSSTISLTSEWAYHSITHTYTYAQTGFRAIIQQDTGTTATLKCWGAHLYRSDLGGMVDNPDRSDSYVPTTSSAVYLPRRNHYAYNGGQWVNEGLLTESESRQNLVQESEDFSGYTLTNLASIAVSATPLAPDGNQTALRLLDNSSTSLKALSKSTYTVSVVSGDRVTISAYFQKGTLSYGVIYAVTGSGTPFGASPGSLPVDRAACFDLDNGNVGEVGSLLSDGRVENVGNGWYRCSVTVIAGGTGTFYPAFGLTNADDGDVTYTSAGTGTVYLWGAQMEVGATPSSYMPTSGSTYTRAAETLTIPSANLPYPTPNVIGPELVTNGTFDTDTGWIKNTGWTIGSGVASYSGGGGNSIFKSIGIVSGVTYQITFDITSISAGGFRVLCGFDNASQTFNTVGSHTANLTGGSNAFIYVQAVASTVGSIDNISVKEIDPLSVSIQMDGRMTYADNNSGTEHSPYVWDTGSEWVRVFLTTAGAYIGAFDFNQRYDGATDRPSGTTDFISPGILTPFNIASRHGSTFVNGAVDGTALTENTTPVALTDLSSTDLQLAYDYMGTIRTFRIWDADLTDEGIAYVSERSEEPTISLSFNSSESSFTVSDWLP